jgi:hypothetical protein
VGTCERGSDGGGSGEMGWSLVRAENYNGFGVPCFLFIVLGSLFWVLCSGFFVLGFLFLVLGCGFRVQGCGFSVIVTAMRNEEAVCIGEEKDRFGEYPRDDVAGWGLRVLCSLLFVLCSLFRVSCSLFWVAGSEFRVAGSV